MDAVIALLLYLTGAPITDPNNPGATVPTATDPSSPNPPVAHPDGGGIPIKQ